MGNHNHLYTPFYAPEATDHIREWVSQTAWNFGLTIQPCNPRYTADDMESLGSGIIDSLQRMLGVRRGLWICFIREQSRTEGLWHLHGLMRVESNKRIKWMIRHGEDRLRLCCHQFAAGRGSRHSDPSVHIFNESIVGGDKWESYINKEEFKDPDSDRWIFGRPH
jgi:hypothetical protein